MGKDNGAGYLRLLKRLMQGFGYSLDCCDIVALDEDDIAVYVWHQPFLRCSFHGSLLTGQSEFLLRGLLAKKTYEICLVPNASSSWVEYTDVVLEKILSAGEKGCFKVTYGESVADVCDALWWCKCEVIEKSLSDDEVAVYSGWDSFEGMDEDDLFGTDEEGEVEEDLDFPARYHKDDSALGRARSLSMRIMSLVASRAVGISALTSGLGYVVFSGEDDGFVICVVAVSEDVVSLIMDSDEDCRVVLFEGTDGISVCIEDERHILPLDVSDDDLYIELRDMYNRSF